jgi:hypothetical protein
MTRLQEYIELAELYESDTLDKLIIKKYALIAWRKWFVF